MVDEHIYWHMNIDGAQSSFPAWMGFLAWHGEFIRRFDLWRQEFGYNPVAPWYPGRHFQPVRNSTPTRACATSMIPTTIACPPIIRSSAGRPPTAAARRNWRIMRLWTISPSPSKAASTDRSTATSAPLAAASSRPAARTTAACAMRVRRRIRCSGAGTVSSTRCTETIARFVPAPALRPRPLTRRPIPGWPTTHRCHGQRHGSLARNSLDQSRHLEPTSGSDDGCLRGRSMRMAITTRAEGWCAIAAHPPITRIRSPESRTTSTGPCETRDRTRHASFTPRLGSTTPSLQPGCTIRPISPWFRNRASSPRSSRTKEQRRHRPDPVDAAAAAARERPLLPLHARSQRAGDAPRRDREHRRRRRQQQRSRLAQHQGRRAWR